MSNTLNISLYLMAARKELKRDAAFCLKCLELPHLTISNDFCDKYAYGYKISMHCKCGLICEGVADGMDGRVGGKISETVAILTEKWNKKKLATFGMPTNTVGLVQ